MYFVMFSIKNDTVHTKMTHTIKTLRELADILDLRYSRRDSVDKLNAMIEKHYSNMLEHCKTKMSISELHRRLTKEGISITGKSDTKLCVDFVNVVKSRDLAKLMNSNNCDKFDLDDVQYKAKKLGIDIADQNKKELCDEISEILERNEYERFRQDVRNAPLASPRPEWYHAIGNKPPQSPEERLEEHRKVLAEICADSSLIGARKIAKSLNIDTKNKTKSEICKEIEASVRLEVDRPKTGSAADIDDIDSICRESPIKDVKEMASALGIITKNKTKNEICNAISIELETGARTGAVKVGAMSEDECVKKHSKPELVELAKQFKIPHSRKTKSQLCAEIVKLNRKTAPSVKVPVYVVSVIVKHFLGEEKKLTIDELLKYKQVTAVGLKNYAKTWGISTSGTKLDILRRVNDKLSSAVATPAPAPAKAMIDAICSICKGPRDEHSQICTFCQRSTRVYGETEPYGGITSGVDADERARRKIRDKERKEIERKRKGKESQSVDQTVRAIVDDDEVAEEIVERIDERVNEHEIIDMADAIQETEMIDRDEAIELASEREISSVASSVVDEALDEARISQEEATDLHEQFETRRKELSEELFDIPQQEEEEEEEPQARETEINEPVRVKRVLSTRRINEIEEMLEEISDPKSKLSQLQNVQKSVYSYLGLVV